MVLSRQQAQHSKEQNTFVLYVHLQKPEGLLYLSNQTNNA